jgi:NAD(P)-dependent dehydrogenase (short-subunit alcohol dehydrogenase family)
MSSTQTNSEHGSLLGQTVVVIGGSSCIGLETARRALGEGAKLMRRTLTPVTRE